MDSAPIKEDLVYLTRDGTVKRGDAVAADQNELPPVTDVLGRVQYEWKCKADAGSVYREFVTTDGTYVSDSEVVERDAAPTLTVNTPLTEDEFIQALDEDRSPAHRQRCDVDSLRRESSRIVEKVNTQVRMFAYKKFYSFYDKNDRPAGANQQFRINLPDQYYTALAASLSELEGVGREEAQLAARTVPETITVEIRLGHSSVSADSSVETAHETSIDPAQMEKPAQVDFGDVAGMDDLKTTLREDVIFPLQHPDLYDRYGVGMVNGVLLYGPPGTGKSYVSEALAGELGYSYVEVSAADISGGVIGQTARNIQALFDYARRNQPCILFFDEFDNIATDRSATDNTQSERQGQNQLLQELSSIGDDDVLVIAATNKHDDLDAAAVRRGRFDREIEIGPPDGRSRLEILSHHLSDRPFDESTVDEPELVETTSGFSAAGMKALAEQAARSAAQQHRESGSPKEITHDHLVRAADAVEPEYGPEITRKYDVQTAADSEDPVFGPAADSSAAPIPLGEIDEIPLEETDVVPDEDDQIAGPELDLASVEPSEPDQNPEVIGRMFVPVRNDLWRALGRGENIQDGVQMTLDELDDRLAEYGITIISPSLGDETDPRRHKVTYTDNAPEPDGTIIEVMEPGYAVDGTVKEPARVATSDGPAE